MSTEQAADGPAGPGPRGGVDDIVGVLLAAGAGRRAGGPKALRIEADGTSSLLRSIEVLRAGGCPAVIVVLGCSAARARDVIAGSRFDGDPRIVVAEALDWEQGMGVSLRAGLEAVTTTFPPTGPGGTGSWRAVLVHLVDLPDVTAAVVGRMIGQAPTGTNVLARATYGGRPGHPVLLGRDHLRSIMVELTADRGAKDYLARHRVDGVECGDLATGRDRDR